MRPPFLTIGSLACVAAALYATYANARDDVLLSSLVLLFLLYWTFAFPAAVNSADDGTAYLVFARDFYYDLERTVQPLSERRLFSVGGSYAFQAPILRWFGTRGLQLMEPVFGVLLLSMLVTVPSATTPLFRYAAVVVIGLAPFAGARVLPNSASAFVLAAFTLALLQLGAHVVRGDRLTRPMIVLIVVLPLTAALYRPTTLPFNALLAGMILLLPAVRARWKVVVAASAAAAAAMLPALLPYHASGATVLFPVLGRGNHISAAGLAISASVTATQHLSNLIAALGDPWLIANLLLAAAVLMLSKSRTIRQGTALVTGLFVVLYVVMVVSTAGWGAGRFMFPIAIALILLQMGTASHLAKPAPQRVVRRVAYGCVLCIAAVLAGVRFTVGAEISGRRMRGHQVPGEHRAHIYAVQRMANSHGARAGTLIINTSYARHLVPGLIGTYFVMDQPGMMLPWHRETADYTAGFSGFIVEHNIATIILYDFDCEASGAIVGGWYGLTQRAEIVNRRAVCQVMNDSRVDRMGRFTVVTPRGLSMNSRQQARPAPTASQPR